VQPQAAQEMAGFEATQPEGHSMPADHEVDDACMTCRMVIHLATLRSINSWSTLGGYNFLRKELQDDVIKCQPQLIQTVACCYMWLSVACGMCKGSATCDEARSSMKS
jgi:hypothetical protein